MRAIHFICRRDDGLSLRNVTFDKATKMHRSGNWEISADDARSLVGGWIYLHPKKSALSEFGGVIRGFEPVKVREHARSNRIVLILEKRPEGSGQRWRGATHSMAHSSGPIVATYSHELDSA